MDDLINNAFTYTIRTPRLVIGLSTRSRKAIVGVEDNGVGIRPPTASRSSIASIGSWTRRSSSRASGLGSSSAASSRRAMAAASRSRAASLAREASSRWLCPSRAPRQPQSCGRSRPADRTVGRARGAPRRTPALALRASFSQRASASPIGVEAGPRRERPHLLSDAPPVGRGVEAAEHGVEAQVDALKDHVRTEGRRCREPAAPSASKNRRTIADANAGVMVIGASSKHGGVEEGEPIDDRFRRHRRTCSSGIPHAPERI